MRQSDSQILHSPSDLVRYLGCAQARLRLPRWQGEEPVIEPLPPEEGSR